MINVLAILGKVITGFAEENGLALKNSDRVKNINKNTKGWQGSDGGQGGGDDKGSQSSEDYSKNGEEAHNVLRKVHGAKEMKMNSEMSKAAEEYAKKLASTGSFQHSSRDERKGDGENLAMKCTSEKGDEMSAEEATKNWWVFDSFFLEYSSI